MYSYLIRNIILHLQYLDLHILIHRKISEINFSIPQICVLSRSEIEARCGNI